MIANDYSMSRKDAEFLMGVSLLPDEFRIELLLKYCKDHSLSGLINLFSAFIGLANSVVSNNREWLETFLVVESVEHPDRVHQINLPTIQGALNGITVAIPATNGMCEGCAFRLGTVANQCHSTTLDAKGCVEDSSEFMCHMDMDENLHPVHRCVGYALQVGEKKS